MFAILNLRLIGAILAVLVTFSAGWYVEHLRFQNYKTKVEVAAQAQELHNKEVEKQHLVITEGIKNDYEKKLGSISAMYGRMRQSSSSEVSATTDAAITINGKSIDTLSLAQECAVETQRLVSLQGWVKQEYQVK